MTKLQNRILDISKKFGLSHIGSSLTSVEIIKEIYDLKRPDEKFILSNGHAGLALYVVMYNDDEVLPIRNNIHADKSWCDCSTGSLGHGLGIAAGMALSDKTKNVYVMISDGECAEGSIWEALRIASEQNLTNLKVYVNANGWASYQPIDLDILEKRLKAFFPIDFRRTKQEEPFTGLHAHYGKI